MEKLGITVSLMSGYHPQANGQVEKAHQEIGQFLSTFCANNQEAWAVPSFHGHSMCRTPSVPQPPS